MVPSEEATNFSTRAGAIGWAWIRPVTSLESFTAKVRVLGELQLQVYDSAKSNLQLKGEIQLPLLPASHASCNLFHRDVRQTVNNSM